MADLINPILAAGGAGGNLFENSGGDDGTFEWYAWWANHNSGSHSEMEVRGHNLSGKSFNYVMVKITFNGVGSIYSVDNVTNCSNFSLNGNTLTIVQESIINPGQSISFGIPDIKFTNPQYKKYDNVTNSYLDVKNCSYYETSDSAHCNCVAAEFSVSYYYSI